MATSNPAENWMAEGYSGSATARTVERTAEERFEAEAMPYMTDIFRTASRLLRERSRAEDATQEVFLQAWKSFHRFETGTNCRAWLYKILFHCVIHERRKWFRFPVLKEPEEIAETVAPYA